MYLFSAVSPYASMMVVGFFFEEFIFGDKDLIP
jgi:hypothetical protein